MTRCQGALDCLSLEAQTEEDMEDGIENDFAETNVNVFRLRRVQSQPLSDTERHAFARIFESIDTHYSPGRPGRIFRRDIAAYFAAHYNPLRPEELEELMDVADVDKSGELSKDEFLQVAKKIIDSSPTPGVRYS